MLTKGKKYGFTLIELLIVIAIIGIMAGIAIVSLSNSRVSSRDTKRVADVTTLVKALEMYFLNNNSYPTQLIVGQPIKDVWETYLYLVPSNPTPRNDGNCSLNDYSYVYSSLSNTFAIGYCLGNGVANIISGLHVATTGSLTQSGLVGWLKFDENTGTQIIDSAGNYAGTATNVTWEPYCRLGPCLAFNGNNSYIELFNNTPTGSKTIITWVYFNSLQNNHQAIFGDGLIQVNANDKLAYKDPVLEYVFSDGTLTAMTWYNLAFVFNDSNNTLTFYINGQSSGEVVVTSFDVMSNYIGARRPGSGNSIFPLDGKLDDIRIYNRVLSDVEIMALYNASK